MSERGRGRRAENGEERAPFGASRVAVSEKTGLVRDLFGRVAGSYDRMNDLMSLGLHRAWKDALVARLGPRAGWRVLDVAGGTGDVALRLARRASAGGGRPLEVVVADLTPEMLSRGRARSLDAGFWEAEGGRKDAASISWVRADAESLPFADGSFDAAALAFGLRNMARPVRALSEVHRVLRFGGRFAVLEFSRPDAPWFSGGYRFWSERVIPRLGAAVAGDEAAYRYLVESIESFAEAEEVSAWLRDAGFRRVSSERLTGGIAGLHLAWKF